MKIKRFDKCACVDWGWNEVKIVPRFPSSIRWDEFSTSQNGFFSITSSWDLEATSSARQFIRQTASLTCVANTSLWQYGLWISLLSLDDPNLLRFYSISKKIPILLKFSLFLLTLSEKSASPYWMFWRLLNMVMMTIYGRNWSTGQWQSVL